MKNYLKTGLLCLALSTGLVGYVHSVSADDTEATTQTAPKKHHGHGFRMGVCVGQTLAQQGVTLSATPGDTSNHEAFQAAIQSCRAQFKNRAPASTAPNS